MALVSLVLLPDGQRRGPTLWDLFGWTAVNSADGKFQHCTCQIEKGGNVREQDGGCAI